MNEIRIMRNIDHPNIIHLYEVYETENSVYLVMELYRGKSLSDFLERVPIVEEGLASTIMTGIISSLKYLKREKIMHRDLKPQNILFKNKDKVIKPENIIVVDFGLAQK